ncbi:MAG TPA: aminotransferase class I/II-fold pyridoxal phosphate-dependent enzyme, partial [Pirellulaceae bacterium]
MKSYARPEIADLSGYVPGEQPPPGKFVKLNTNENPYPPSDAVVRALQEACAVGLRRYPDPQATAFRLRAADVYGIDPAQIICGNGSDDLLTIAVRTFVGAGQALRVPTPSYTLYETLAGLQGARCDAIPFQPDWTLPEHFGDVAEDVRLVILANPNSPSGSFVSPADVLHLANRLPCPLLVDEAYVEFSDQDCLDLVGRAENIIVTRSLSKSHALAGLRFGFAVAPPHLIEPMLKL